MVATIVPIMAKLNAILRSEYVNTWEFLHSLGKDLKVMMILPLKSIFYSGITLYFEDHDFKDFPILAPNKNNFKVKLMESSNQ